MRVALVLGSGGARGYAHMGVIAELLARGHEVVTVAGTSMGALVGALLAAGKLDTFEQWAVGLTQRDVLRLVDPTLTGPGMVKADRVLAEVSRMLDGAQIEDLPIPFTAVATDLTNHREVWFQRGPADVAIRASIAIPSLITPVLMDGRLLADGGITNPVPVEPTVAVASDITIAVDLSGPSMSTPGIRKTTEPQEEETQPTSWMRAASQAAKRLIRTTPEVAIPTYSTLPDDVRLVDVVTSSLDTMKRMIARFRLAANPPDVLVEIPIDLCSTYDFHRAAYASRVGRQLAQEAFDRAGI